MHNTHEMRDMVYNAGYDRNDTRTVHGALRPCPSDRRLRYEKKTLVLFYAVAIIRRGVRDRVFGN